MNKTTAILLTLALSGCLHDIEVEVDGEVEVVSPVLEEVAELTRIAAQQSLENYAAGIRRDADIEVIKRWIESRP